MLHSLMTFSSLLLFSQAVHAAELPADIQAPLDAAIATENQIVIDATVSHLAEKNPEHKDSLLGYILARDAAVTETVASEAELAALAPSAGEPENEEGFEYSGEIEAGLEMANGNSEYENYFTAGKIERNSEDWTHKLTGRMRNNAENDVRTAEEYRAEWQTNRNLSEMDYVFANAEYVKDTFSGYDYRMQETIGYGRTLLEGETYKLVGEAGAGFRHTDQTPGDREDEFIQTIKGIFDWDITDSLRFGQTLESTFGSEAVVTESETTLTSKLTSALDLRARVNVEHIDNVPPGTAQTDTTTGLNLVYGF